MTRLLRHQGYPREEEQLNELDGADVDRPLGERKREEQYFSIAWTPTITFSTRVLFKAILEGAKLITAR